MKNLETVRKGTAMLGEAGGHDCKQDIVLLKEHFNKKLPLLMLHCGSGATASVIHQFFKPLICIDKHPRVIRAAQEKFSNGSLEFRQMDILEGNEVRDFYEENGPVNIYWTGSMQQIPIREREVFIQHMKLLMGTEGCLFFMELSPSVGSYLRNVERELGSLEEGVGKALINKVADIVGLNKAELRKIFSRKHFDIIEFSERRVQVPVSDGKTAEVPVNYVLLRNK